MSSRSTPQIGFSLPKPANDNEGLGQLRAEVLLSRDLPITQVEIEVFALLIEDLSGLAANDNEDQ